MGRALGVDVGTVRVGLAISDPHGMVATPLATLDGGEGLIGRLVDRAKVSSCDTVVVGLPRALSGRDTASTVLVRELAEGLVAAGLRVEFWDERLSSVEAERTLIGARRRREQRREERDRVAAAIILQGWLDAQRRPASRE